MPLSITGRLLCAAEHAYSITANGPVPDALPYSTAVGYPTPAGCVAGIASINAALVGEASDAIILAFRGTLPPGSPSPPQVIRDWANDVNGLLVQDPGFQNLAPFPGLVHQGFLGSLNALWPGVTAALAPIFAASPTKPLYITGHSKGGPLANLAALRLSLSNLGRPITVCTFAGARAGDQSFATRYEVVVPNSTRYEYADDIVPHLAPEDAFRLLFQRIPFTADLLQGRNQGDGLALAQGLVQGYVSVGELHFIDWANQLVDDHPGLQFERFSRLSKLFLTFGFQTIIDDHSLSNGYARALCPGL